MKREFEITLDLATAQRSAETVRDMLLALRSRFDLARFEYTTQVRIAPLEIPYSHPKITLNSFYRSDLALLSAYLHEQMHWYVTWYSYIHAPQWHDILQTLRERYPDVPVGKVDGAADAHSIYLHLVVNWLEVEGAAQFIERSKVVEHVCGLHFYRWMYRTVVEDRDELSQLYEDQGLIPIQHATDMSVADLQIAGRMDEARI
jgi:hypothetical protein